MTFTPMGVKTKSEHRQPQPSTRPTSLRNVSRVPSVSKWVRDTIDLQDLENLKMHTLQGVLLFIYAEIGSHYVDQSGLKHTHSTVSVSRALGLEA